MARKPCMTASFWSNIIAVIYDIVCLLHQSMHDILTSAGVFFFCYHNQQLTICWWFQHQTISQLSQHHHWRKEVFLSIVWVSQNKSVLSWRRTVWPPGKYNTDSVCMSEISCKLPPHGVLQLSPAFLCLILNWTNCTKGNERYTHFKIHYINVHKKHILKRCRSIFVTNTCPSNYYTFT